MGTPGGQASLRGEEQLYSLRLATAARHSLPPTSSASSMAYQALLLTLQIRIRDEHSGSLLTLLYQAVLFARP
jgi:hypothetical protein